MSDYPPTDDVIVAMQREFRASLPAIIDGREPASGFAVAQYQSRLIGFGLVAVRPTPPRQPSAAVLARREKIRARTLEAQRMRAGGYSIRAIAQKMRTSIGTVQRALQDPVQERHG